MIPRVPINQKCKQDETPQVFYFTDAHSTTIFSWLEGSAYETSACNSVHALTLNACSTALQFCRTTIVQHTDRKKGIVQLKFVFSKKAKKIDEIVVFELTLTT